MQKPKTIPPKQQAFSFDRHSLSKIGNGILISLGGALLAGFVLLAPEVGDFILKADPVMWRPAVFAAWGAFSTSIINAVREYVRGDK